jgi:hypothetical protein
MSSGRKPELAICWWLMPILLVTQEAEIRRIMIQSQPSRGFVRLYLKKTRHKKELVEWLKV